MKISRFALVVVVFLTPSPLPARAKTIVERAVTFKIVNSNTSLVPCVSDGKTYEVRGSLAAPASAFRSRHLGAVTLYVHGSGNAEVWDLAAVPGYDHIAEMAKLGHVSLFMRGLGFGNSDSPTGEKYVQGHL